MKLFIDDIRMPSDVGYKNGDFMIARTADEAKRMMQAWKFNFISFDHDLGEDNGTGYEVAKWMVDMDCNHLDNMFVPGFAFNVHSANPIGAENIQKLLDNYLNFKNEAK